MTECRHPNIVKILDASFDGKVVKEQRVGSDNDREQLEIIESQLQTSKGLLGLSQSPGNMHGETDKAKTGTELSIVEQVDNSSSVGIYYDEVDDMVAQQSLHLSKDAVEGGDKQLGSDAYNCSSNFAGYHQDSSGTQHQQELGEKNSLVEQREDEYFIVKRKSEVCYYVMKLAEFGELYSFIEHTDRFTEDMTRYILDQLVDGMKYLHAHGIVHRDIKPENLLINKKGRIIIADFSFATRMNEIESDELFQKRYDPMIEMRTDVGSEIFNAPEIWDNEINLHEIEEQIVKAQGEDKVIDYSALDAKLRKLSMFPKYNAEKADIFSIGASLFMIQMQSPPFRKAVQTDPYFKRLSSSKKQNFWKIFKGIPHSEEFKDLMEKILTKYPSQRYGLDQVRGSKFFDIADDNEQGTHGQVYSPESFLEEIKHRFDIVESMKENDLSNKANPEQNSCYYSETEIDEDLLNKENLEFQESRIGYIS